ncbi:phosphatase PAP2 family protein [Phormidium tenue FACHB-886]|nr:phosphatase PAP2 family protein [Phormidium tenue FACHB-886]
MFKVDLPKRFQSFGQFFKRWLSQRWRLLLLLFLGVYIPLQVFSLLALEIWQHQGGLQWDISIMNAIHAAAGTKLDLFAKIFTRLGTSWGVFPVSALISVVLLVYRRWRSLTYFLITVLGCGLINHSAKVYWHRDRPSLWDYPPSHGFSFPSGHAMSSMGFVAALIILLWGTRWRWLVLVLGSAFVVTIGWTRLYLGVHYPSDILAGWMAALAWAIGVSSLVRPHLQPPNLLKPAEAPVPEDELIPEA